MRNGIRQHRPSHRASERIPLCARIHVTTLSGKPIAPLSNCTNLGIGGLCVTAASGVTPGTRVRVELVLPTGRRFVGRGRVTWSKTTLHPAIFGSPRGRDDDAHFGIAFEEAQPEALLPIARLLVARQDERRRARRIRRRHGLAIAP